MHFIVLAALALPAVSLAAPAGSALPPPPASAADRSDCGRNGLIMAESRNKAQVKRLGELPTGALSLTVLREVDGCTKPVIVRYGYGAGPGERPGAATKEISRR